MADDEMIEHIGHGRPLGSDLFAENDPAHHPVAYLKVVDQANRLKAVLEWSSVSGTYIYCCVFK